LSGFGQIRTSNGIRDRNNAAISGSLCCFTIIPERVPDLGNFMAINLLPRFGFVRKFEQSLNSQVDN